MTRSKDEQAAAEWFRDRYDGAPSDGALDLERTVIGGDFGANGYATIAQASLIAERLRLRAGNRLVDIGSGRGWPGLYLAKATDCSVVLTDLPEEGLRTARQRAVEEGVGGRAWSWRAPDVSRSRTGRSTPSSIPTSCVDWRPSSPC